MSHQKVLISWQVCVCKVWLVVTVLVRPCFLIWWFRLLFLNLAHLLSVLLEKRLLKLQILLCYYLQQIRSGRVVLTTSSRLSGGICVLGGGAWGGGCWSRCYSNRFWICCLWFWATSSLVGFDLMKMWNFVSYLKSSSLKLPKTTSSFRMAPLKKIVKHCRSTSTRFRSPKSRIRVFTC